MNNANKLRSIYSRTNSEQLALTSHSLREITNNFEQKCIIK